VQTADKLTYEDAWTFLDQLQFFKIKLGLDSMTSFMEPLDSPHLKFPSIHIAGTNGKGSVGSTLLAILTAAGYKVGFYTSPHLSSVRERLRINDTYISREAFAKHAQQIISILEGRQITYFEFTTALAMLWFAEEKVDLALLEVGLGGRLDATNIVTPLVSVITNVSMDHEIHLGNTIEEIAFEKAGIIKSEVPVVTGVHNKKALAVISDIAAKQGSRLYLLGHDFSGKKNADNPDSWFYQGIHCWDRQALPINMKGAYQVGNAALALATLEIAGTSFPVAPEHIRQGLKKVQWPGRLEEFWLTPDKMILRELSPADDAAYHFLLDGAHNPDGATALRISLENEFNNHRLILVWASMADKDVKYTLMQIAPLAEQIIFTKPDEERSANPASLTDLLPNEQRQHAECIDNVELALERAIAHHKPGSLICVAGSLYLVGKARQILCGELVGNE